MSGQDLAKLRLRLAHLVGHLDEHMAEVEAECAKLRAAGLALPALPSALDRMAGTRGALTELLADLGGIPDHHRHDA